MPEDLVAIAEELRERRPRPGADTLDTVKQRVRSRTAGSGAIPRGAPMRARVAIALTLTAGLIMSGGSAGLAVSGISDSGSSGAAQYPRNSAPQPPGSGGGGGDVGDVGDESIGGGKGGPADEGTPGGAGAPADDVQVVRQIEAGSDSDSLPFTGLAAIPLLLAGIGLVIAGLVMRRRWAVPPTAG